MNLVIPSIHQCGLFAAVLFGVAGGRLRGTGGAAMGDVDGERERVPSTTSELTHRVAN